MLSNRSTVRVLRYHPAVVNHNGRLSRLVNSLKPQLIRMHVYARNETFPCMYIASLVQRYFFRDTPPSLHLLLFSHALSTRRVPSMADVCRYFARFGLD